MTGQEATLTQSMVKANSLVQDTAEFYQAFCNGLQWLKSQHIAGSNVFSLLRGRRQMTDYSYSPGEGCFGPDTSYQRCSITRLHGPSLVESHHPECSRWPSLKSSAVEKNSSVPQIFSIRATLAFLYEKGSIPHIKNSSQVLAWSRANLSQKT